MSKQSQDNDAVSVEDPAVAAGQSIRIELDFDPNTHQLSAIAADADTPLSIDLSYLNALIKQHGYQHFFFEQDALQQLLSRLDDGERGRFALGERRDARLTIEVAEDAMFAVAKAQPHFGGVPFNKAQVESKLREAGVNPGCWDHAALQQLVKATSSAEYKIANSIVPEAGTDSKFIALVEGVIKHPPSKVEHGKVNQYEVYDFVVVEPGTLLMRRIPATPGIDGMDVNGTLLPATAGKHESFTKDMPGVVRDDNDNNLLIASTKGHPVVTATGVSLDEVLKLQSVDMRTGNVNFDGSIYVAGDVSASVNLKATGDVIIKGSVAQANIQADADILISGGAVNPEPHQDQMPHVICLEAGGNIEAKFVSGAQLKTGGDVVVKEYIGFSTTQADGQVLVGQSGGKGTIYGGSCHAYDAVLANRLGSKSSVPTLISVGLITSTKKCQSELDDELASLEEQGKKVQLLLEKTRCESPMSTPSDKQAEAQLAALKPLDETLCDKLSNTLNAINEQQRKTQHALADLAKQLDVAAKASIFVTKEIRAGVSLQINGVQREFKSRDTGGSFKLQADAVARSE